MFAILHNPFLQVFFLSDIGGIALVDVVRRVLSFVLSNDVALQFNFIGRQNKKRIPGHEVLRSYIRFVFVLVLLYRYMFFS